MPTTIVIKPDESGLSLLIPIISVIGVIGNVTVLVVYLRKMRNSGGAGGAAGRSLTNIFIATLAFNDLVACAVVMPLTLIYELAPSLIFTTNLSCKLYFLVTTSVIPFSAFLMTAISVDRYLCICQPLKKILTPVRARITVIVLAVTAVIMGTLVAIQYIAAANASIELDPTTAMIMQNYTSDPSLYNTSSPAYDVTYLSSDESTVSQGYESTYSSSSNSNNSIEDYITSTTFTMTGNAGGCTTEPVFGKSFETYYHYIHNTITFVVALALTFIFYALIYSRIWSRHLQKANRKAATSRALQQKKDNNNLAVPNNNGEKPKILITAPSFDGPLGAQKRPSASLESNNPINNTNKENLPLIADNDNNKPPSNGRNGAGADLELVDKSQLRPLNGNEMPGEPSRDRKNSEGAHAGVSLKQSFKISGELATQIRLAAMLFVVTVVFTLSYVPAFLANYTPLFGDPDNDHWNRFVFYIYFVNNAANPIIYGVMNRNFREDLRHLCCGQPVGQGRPSNNLSTSTAAKSTKSPSRIRSLI